MDDEKADKKVTKPTQLHGFSFIGKMSKAELVEELLSGQRGYLERCGTEELKKYLINFRVAEFQKRLVEEAELEPPAPFGFINFGGGD